MSIQQQIICQIDAFLSHSSREVIAGLSNADLALFSFAKNNDADSLRDALAAGANPLALDKHGQTAIHSAAINGHRECVALLLPVSDLKARDGGGKTAGQRAARNGQLECASLIEGFLRASSESADLDSSAPPTQSVSHKPKRRL